MNWLLLAMALAVPPDAAPIVNAAIADVARRFAVKAEAVEVQRVTWPDSSLGCPQEGMLYTQRTVPGWRIVLAAGSRSFEYHAAEKGDPVHCPPGRAQPALPDAKT